MIKIILISVGLIITAAVVVGLYCCIIAADDGRW